MEDWNLAIVAALVLVYAGCSRRLERTVLTGPILFVGAGLLVGSDGLGWLDLRLGSSAVRVLAEATLTLVLFTDASRIDIRALRREFALPARLLGLGLPLTIVAGMAIAVGLLTQLTWPEALVLAIVLAPTDAALGQQVVTDPPPARTHPAGPERRERPQRRDLRAVALHRARDRGGRGRCDHACARLSDVVLDEIGWGLVGGVVAGVAAAVDPPRSPVGGTWSPTTGCR